MNSCPQTTEFLLIGYLKRREVEYGFRNAFVDRWIVLIPQKLLIYAKEGI